MNDCHLVSYRKNGFNPVAIASRTRETATTVAEAHGIPSVEASYEAILERDDLDILDIAVPPDATVPLILKACAAGKVKGILAQKPLGMDYHQALQAVQACEAAGIVLAVNQNGRYDPSVRAGKVLLDSGALGEPILGSIDMRAIPHWMPWQAEMGWVTLRIMSIHHLDMFRYWFGAPERIYASARTDPRTTFPHRDGICAYILEYANGLRAMSLDDTWTGPAREGAPAEIGIGWRIEGDQGWAIGDIGWCQDPYTSPSTLRYARIGDADAIEPTLEGSWFPDAFGGTMGALMRTLETGETCGISGRENLGTMALVDAAYLSLETRRAVEISEITERS